MIRLLPAYFPLKEETVLPFEELSFESLATQAISIIFTRSCVLHRYAFHVFTSFIGKFITKQGAVLPTKY